MQFEWQNSSSTAFAVDGTIYSSIYQICKIGLPKIFDIVRIITLKQQNFVSLMQS